MKSSIQSSFCGDKGGINLPVNKALFLSSTDLWETPQWIFDQLNQEFHFICDVCALPENAKCSLFFTPEMDGLQQNWKGVCWMNPPYGRKIRQWVKRAFEQSILHAATVVCLLPSRTDTSWWHDYCMKGEIRFVRGRLKFGSSKNSAPFPSAVVIFSKNASVNTIKSVFLTRIMK